MDVIGWSVLCKTCSSPAGTAQVLKSAFYFLSRQMSLLSTWPTDLAPHTQLITSKGSHWNWFYITKMIYWLRNENVHWNQWWGTCYTTFFYIFQNAEYCQIYTHSKCQVKPLHYFHDRTKNFYAKLLIKTSETSAANKTHWWINIHSPSVVHEMEPSIKNSYWRNMYWLKFIETSFLFIIELVHVVVL